MDRALSGDSARQPAAFGLRGVFRELTASIAPPRGGKIAERFQRLRSKLWIAAVIAVIWAVYVFFMSAGGLSRWPIYGTYYDLMADGFRMGQLHLPLEVHPQLLRAKNPYDMANIRYWALDASYYAGKYYAYWGPVPGIFQAIGKSALGIHRTIGDHPVALFHLFVGGWAGTVLVARIARRLFGNVSRALIAIAAFSLAFANPVLHGATTGGTYQTAILAAQAWLLTGLVPAFDAVFLADSVRTRRWSLVFAGAAWALALASRVTVIPTVAAFVLFTGMAEGCGFERRFRRMFASTVWAGLPVAIVGIALLVYNKVRFDDWLEFGTNIQLSAFPIFRVSREYLLPNLYSYMLRPFATSCEFPFFFQEWRPGREVFPEGFFLPRDYQVLEPVVGWLRAIPLTWLMPFAVFCAPWPLSRKVRAHRAYLWCFFMFSALSTVTGLVGMGVYGTTMRYMSDISTGLVLMSLLAVFALKTHRFGKLAPRTTSALFVALAAATIVFGMVLGYQGYAGHFARFNTKLHEKLTKTFSVCGDRQPHIPRFWP